jgi:hypothetical protein
MLVLVLIPGALLLTVAAALVPDIIEESTDLRLAGPVSNACAINLANGLVDAFWTTSLNDGSEGSATDPNEGPVPDEFDGLGTRVCNSATALFFWARRAGAAGTPAGVHFYMDTDASGVADYDLLMNFGTAQVELHVNSPPWNSVPLTAADRFDFSLDGLSMEIGIDLALIGAPTSLQYYTTTEADAVPDGAFRDRVMDAGWTGPYSVPEIGAASAFIAAVLLPISMVVAARRRRPRSTSGRP